MLITAAVLAALPAIAPTQGDFFGSVRNHRLEVPGWGLKGLTPERLESGDIDGDQARDVCLLARDGSTGFATAYVFLDVAEIIAPQAISDGASDLAIIPEGWAEGPGVIVANGSGLKIHGLLSGNVVHGAAIPGSSAFANCTQLSLVLVQDALGIVALNPAGQVVSATWEQGTFDFDGARSYPGAQSVVGLTWQLGQLSYGVAGGANIDVYDSSSGALLRTEAIDPGPYVLRTQARPAGTDRLVVSSESKIRVIDPAASTAQVISTAYGRIPSDLDFGDFDGDGNDDILISVENHPEAWVLYGEPWGSTLPAFGLHIYVPGRPFLLSLASVVGNRMTAGDFDGDHDVDAFYVETSPELRLVSRDNLNNNSFDVMPRVLVGSIKSVETTTAGTLVAFDFSSRVKLPSRTTALGQAVLGGADGLKVDVFVQETPDSMCPRTPWFTGITPLPTTGDITGFSIRKQIDEDLVDGVFLFRLQHVEAADPLGAPLHFTFSFNETNNNTANGESNWSEFIDGDDGTNQAGEHNQRGATSPPEPPPA